MMIEHRRQDGLQAGNPVSGSALALVLMAVLLLNTAASHGQEADTAKGSESKEDGSVIKVPGATLGRIGESAAVNPDEFEFTEAEIKLWLDDHLENIEKPSRLYYEFVKSGSYEDGFTDSVYLDITDINEDGTKHARLEFFSAERQQQVRPDNVTGITANPVLGLYLQGDVYEMDRLTGGSWRYFHRRVKQAFANAAKVETVTFRYQGREVSGRKISIKPYLHDPRRNQFKEFSVKSYEFILSESVPGKLFQIKTVVPDKENPDQPLMKEVLTLQSVKS